MSAHAPAREQLARRIAGEIALSDSPGRAMRTWRERFRLPQVELAEYLGVSPSVISDYESGRRKSPGTSTIRRFVLALLALDEQKGGQVVAAFVRLMDVNLVDLNIVLAMNDFAWPMTCTEFCNGLDCQALTGHDLMDREIYGYSLVDLERAVKELESEDFLRLFGAATERCLLFTAVTNGRAAMIAIKSQQFRPGMVVLHGATRVDRLAIDLAEQMHIPLATCNERSVEALVRALKAMAPDELHGLTPR